MSWIPLAQSAADADPHGAHHASAAAKADAPYVDGEVKRIDRTAGTIALKHGAIANLDMPPMSMVFRASDPAMLANVKEGDKVRFKADSVGGKLTVTELQRAN